MSKQKRIHKQPMSKKKKIVIPIISVIMLITGIVVWKHSKEKINTITEMTNQQRDWIREEGKHAKEAGW